MSTDRREPDFSEVELDDEKRAKQALEDAGGLPEDNPFTELVEELREDGESWSDIFWTMEEVHKVVDKAAHEEDWEFIPEWKVAVIKPASDTPSGQRYEYQTRTAETAEEAEERARKATGYDVEESETEQVGVAKVS